MLTSVSRFECGPPSFSGHGLGEVRRRARRLLHPGRRCHHDVRRGRPHRLEQRAQLAPRHLLGVPGLPDRAVREQGGGEGAQGQDEADHVPPQEEPAVLRDLGEDQLQLRETVSPPRARHHRDRPRACDDVIMSSPLLVSHLVSSQRTSPHVRVQAPSLLPPELPVNQRATASTEELALVAQHALPEGSGGDAKEL